MNIFHKVALRSLLENRARTLVTIIGVMLSAALVTGAVTFGLSLLDYAAAGAAKKYGDWHTAFLHVDEAFVKARTADPEVTGTILAENVGYALLEGGKNPDKPYLYITGFSKKTFDALPVVLLSGRLPENSGEMLIPTHVASNGGVELAPGDSITLPVGERVSAGRALCQHDPYEPGETLAPGEERTYTVTGIYVRPAFEEYTAPGYTAIAGADGTGRGNGFNLFVALQNPRQARAYAADKAEGHGAIFNNQVLRFMGLSEDASDNLFNALLFSIGGIVIVIIAVGSVFLIYNAFDISLNERMRQIGILSSVGATARQIRNAVFFEGLCIGAAGIPLGVCLGLAGIRIVILFVAENFYSIMYSGVPLTLHVSPLAIAAAAAVSLATILISAYLPARKAARTPVMECIRQTNEVKLTADDGRTSGLIQRVFGLPGTLAMKNFKRNRKRYRSIVLSLALSVVLFIATSAFVSDLKQTMTKALSFTTYDIGLGTQTMDDEDMLSLYDRMKNAEGVTESGYQEVFPYACAVPAAALTDAYREAVEDALTGETAELPMELQFLDDATYTRALKEAGLESMEPTGEEARLLAVAKVLTDGKPGEKEVDDFTDLFRDGSTAATLFPMVNGMPDHARGQTVSIVCASIVSPDVPPTKETSAYNAQNLYSFQLLAPWRMKALLVPGDVFPDLRVKGLTFSSQNPAQSAAEMQAMLRDARISSAYLFLNTTEVFEENRNYIFIANVFAYTFIVMISLIAAANVFNTVSTNIKLRRRELAMLRSVGMSNGDFNRMMRFECALYGVRALLMGLPAGMAACYAIYLCMFRGGGEGIVFRLPWGSIGISVCSVLLVIFATMMYAVSKLRKENIIDALRDDMT